MVMYQKNAQSFFSGVRKTHRCAYQGFFYLLFEEKH